MVARSLGGCKSISLQGRGSDFFHLNFEVGCLENGNDDFLKAEGLVLSLSSSLALPCQGKDVYQVRDNLLFTRI